MFFSQMDAGIIRACSCVHRKGMVAVSAMEVYLYLENAYRVCLCEFVPGRELFNVETSRKLESFCLSSHFHSMAPHL